MRVSFIIPAYNEEHTIGRCVESIHREIERSRAEAEIIVVNNASTDGTHAAAARYPYVRVVDEPRKGTNRARQSGFEASSGEYIANIDADSELTPGWLDTAMREFARSPKLVALGGPYIYHDLSGAARAMSAFIMFTVYIGYVINSFVLRTGSQLLGGNCIMRRSALEKIGGYNTSLTFFGDDIDTAKRLRKIGAVKYTYKLPVYSSGRRFTHQGFFKAMSMYFLNFLSGFYAGRAATADNIDVRAPAPAAATVPIESETPEN